jgi:hypothetical protein
MKRYFSYIFRFSLYLFATIGIVFSLVFVGMQYGVFNVKGSIAERDAFFENLEETQIPPTEQASSAASYCTTGTAECGWNETREWQVVRAGLVKDREVIERVSRETGISSRLIAALVIPEQIRFFTSEREVFKRYFEPLKILGSMSQFSLGVSGIKPDTAEKIEQYANDPASVFYPGQGMAELIAYDGGDASSVRYERLTDAKDHYYSYLYTAIYIKEIQSQWEKSGYDISENREVLATLFNLGFLKSKPHPSPKVGGAPITTGGVTYYYGELGALFYNSHELLDIFPKD